VQAPSLRLRLPGASADAPSGPSADRPAGGKTSRPQGGRRKAPPGRILQGLAVGGVAALQAGRLRPDKKRFTGVHPYLSIVQENRAAKEKEPDGMVASAHRQEVYCI
jgi:hypothetical protein